MTEAEYDVSNLADVARRWNHVRYKRLTEARQTVYILQALGVKKPDLYDVAGLPKPVIKFSDTEKERLSEAAQNLSPDEFLKLLSRSES